MSHRRQLSRPLLAFLLVVAAWLGGGGPLASSAKAGEFDLGDNWDMAAAALAARRPYAGGDCSACLKSARPWHSPHLSFSWPDGYGRLAKLAFEDGAGAV